MPAVATGAMLANQSLISIGVSGDGDTASIGLGQFMHLVRRNIPMIYIIENNGVYGLTKGQFSATADEGSRLKTGVINDLPPMDLCALAVELGCGFVARGYAGDPKQMVNILKAAIAHDGLAVIDVISPCVTFNNHDSSTKSYAYSKEHDELLHQIGFVQSYEQIEIDYEPGTVREVTLHDGSRLLLKKLEEDYDPSNAVQALQRSHREEFPDAAEHDRQASLVAERSGNPSAQRSARPDHARANVAVHGADLAQQYAMSNDEKGATEEDTQKIEVIRGAEVLGYEGAGREEHSGENSPKSVDDPRDELADNKPENIR
jgi:pyruvate/2-oxoacid:ferredoxin oxidoreductase beta subunit